VKKTSKKWKKVKKTSKKWKNPPGGKNFFEIFQNRMATIFLPLQASPGRV